MSEFVKGPGWRFQFKGVNLRSSPDAIPADKYGCAVNIRPTSDQSIRVRPGLELLFTNNNGFPFTDLRTYATLETDDNPRILGRDVENNIVLDSGNTVATLAGNGDLGVSMVPFRPSASPQAWMYVAGPSDYQKISAPDANNNCTAYRVGIEEPHSELEAAPIAPVFFDFSGNYGNNSQWVAGGTANNVTTGVRSTDTAGNNIADPVIATRYSVAVAGNIGYQIGELVSFNNSNNTVLVQDVVPPAWQSNILGIYYYSGNNGLCTIVPATVPVGQETPGIPQLSFLRRGALIQFYAGANNATETAFVLGTTTGPNGALAFDTVTVGTYSNNSVFAGIPTIVVDGGHTGTILAQDFEFVQTEGIGWVTQVLGESPFVEAAVQEDDYVHFSINVEDPSQIVEIQIQFNVDPTDSTFTQNYYYYAINPSVLVNVATGEATSSSAVGSGGAASSTTQAENIQASINYLEQQIQAIEQQFGTSSGSGQYAIQGLLSQIDTLQHELSLLPPSTGPGAASGSTAAGALQWTEVMFPVSALTRIGNDQTVTLANCLGVRIWVNTSGAGQSAWQPSMAYTLGEEILDPANHTQKVTTAGTSGVIEPTWNDSGGTTSDGSVVWQDEGVAATVSTNIAISSFWTGGGSQPDVGQTGAPYSYQCKPRGSLTGAQGNPTPAMRYGVNPRRQSVLVKTSAVTNNVDPQVSVIDVYRYGGTITSYRYIGTTPYGSDFRDNYFDDTAAAGTPIGVQDFEPWPSIDVPFTSTGTIKVYGTVIIVTDASVAWPATILNWLPGTDIQLAGQQTFTLRARPTKLSATSYLFYIEECAGFIASAGQFYVNEPIVARQFAPYMDGPDASGTFFAVGENLRPGGVYFAAAYAPDSAPQTNFIEVANPSEPLMRPFVLTGVTLIASTIRWWALYPSFTTAGQYTPYEISVGRAVIGPFGGCTDRQQVYFWAKDGICATAGGPYKNLITDDLLNLFPHEGVQGQNVVRNGITYYAPDYSRASAFRLGVVNNILFADYLDSSNNATPVVYNFSVTVTDANNNTASANCSITLVCP